MARAQTGPWQHNQAHRRNLVEKKELRKVLASFCIASLVSGAGVGLIGGTQLARAADDKPAAGSGKTG